MKCLREIIVLKNLIIFFLSLAIEKVHCYYYTFQIMMFHKVLKHIVYPLDILTLSSFSMISWKKKNNNVSIKPTHTLKYILYYFFYLTL